MIVLIESGVVFRTMNEMKIGNPYWDKGKNNIFFSYLVNRVPTKHDYFSCSAVSNAIFR